MHENLHSYAAKRLLGKECISFPTPVDSVFILRRGQKCKSEFADHIFNIFKR